MGTGRATLQAGGDTDDADPAQRHRAVLLWTDLSETHRTQIDTGTGLRVSQSHFVRSGASSGEITVPGHVHKFVIFQKKACYDLSSF